MNAKGKKVLYIILDVLLYIIGFPALIVLGYFASREFIANEIYGLLAYIPIILPAVSMLICGIVELTLRLSAKKTFKEGRKHRSNVKKQTLKLAISVVVCVCGLMLILDFALPPLLKDATEGTIKYEDIVENYSVQNKAQRQLVDSFIELNVENGFLKDKTYSLIEAKVADGTLTAMSKEAYKTRFEELSVNFRGGTFTNPVDPIAMQSAWQSTTFNAIADKKADIILQYKDEALANTEVTTLIKNVFRSIDGAYAAFNPLLIELAQVDMKYVMQSGDLLAAVMDFYVADSKIRTKFEANGEKKVGVATDQLVVLDIEDYQSIGIDADDIFLFEWTILDMLGEVPEGFDPMILSLFGITEAYPFTHNSRRGALDYMSMAWLDSVSLLGIISIFSVRLYFFMFAGFIALMTLIRGAIRIGYRKANEQSLTEQIDDGEAVEAETEAVAIATDET